MKKLFEFQLPKTQKVTEKETQEKENGETVTTEKEVTKTIPQKIFLKKPTRALFDEAELYYGVKLSEGIKCGLMTRAMLTKRFSNDGGILSDTEKDRYADLYFRLYEVQNELEKSSLTPDKKKSPEEKQKVEELIKELGSAKDELQEFELGQASLFDQTAENRARNKTILWWVLFISYFEDKSGESAPVFPGDSHEEKLAVYDELEESEDEFQNLLIKKLIYYISFWYVGRAQTQEEFEKLLIEIEQESEGLENLLEDLPEGSLEAPEGPSEASEESPEGGPPEAPEASEPQSSEEIPKETTTEEGAAD